VFLMQKYGFLGLKFSFLGHSFNHANNYVHGVSIDTLAYMDVISFVLRKYTTPNALLYYGIILNIIQMKSFHVPVA
jgi:hypothetical protein